MFLWEVISERKGKEREVVVMDDANKLKRAIVDASAGAISGGISRTVTSPLDVIKIRFQV